MPRLLPVALAVLALLTVSRSSAAQEAPPPAWEQAGMADQGFILGFWAHPSGALFVRGPGNLVRSNDNGVTWRRLPMPPTRPAPRNIPSAGGIVVLHPGSPDIVYANGEGGVYRTSDGAQTWSLTFPWPAEGVTHALVISPVDGARLYRSMQDAAGISGTSLARSYDGGSTWEVLPPLPKDVACGYLHRMAPHPTDPDRLFGFDICNNGGDRVWQSRDAGSTWSVLFDLEDRPVRATETIMLGVAPGTEPGRLYLAANYHLGPERRPTGSSAVLFRSDDDGATWTRRATFEPRPDDPERTGVSIYDLAVDPTTPDRLYLALDTMVWQRSPESVQRSGVKVSTDGGATWADLGNPGAAASERPSRLALSAGGHFLYATSTQHIWRLPLISP